MAKFTALSRDELASSTAYAAPGRHASGVRSSVRVSPDDYSIWMVESLLDDGGELRWTGPHSDDGVYVIEGELDVEHDGTVRRCPTEGALIVESGVACTARDQGWYQSGGGVHFLARWFADSTQSTSRIAFFHVALHEAHRRDIPHSHSQDELIYIMDGSLVMGRSEYMPGTCLALPANVRYSVTTGAHGIKFINFRRDASIQEYGKVKDPEPESAIARGGRLVGDLR
jgi:uncharacterized cupin superfamily protein